MIPLWDASRRPVDFPIVTLLLIVINALAFFFELSGGDSFVLRWAAVPSDITHGQHVETLLTSMFLHAGWAHIIGNMIFLWTFGPEIEDVMGRLRYLAFYLLGGLVAMTAQVWIDPASTVPNLGASGAIASVMGAFLITYPRDKIRTLLFLGFFVTMTFLPAAFLIGFWFVVQLISVGIGAINGVNADDVAYVAHVAGALFGIVTVRLFEDRQRLAERAS